MKKVFYILFLSTILFAGCNVEKSKQEKEFLYVGTFSERGSEGLYVYEFSRDSMRFCLMQTLPRQISPSFFAIHPSRKFLYTVCRSSIVEGKDWGTVSAFSIDSLTGKVEIINEKSSYGKAPCHISIDKSGNFAFVSNYSEGNLIVYKLNTDGSLSDSIQSIQHTGSSVNEQRQEKAHIHSAIVSGDNRFVYVSDLGIDKVFVYALQDNGVLMPSSEKAVQQGAGPRHFTFSPSADFAYLSEELSSTTCVFSLNKQSGELTEIQRLSTIPSSYKAQNKNADIHVTPDGKFVYVSNRGHNSIAAFLVNEQSGKLQLIEYESTKGECPRNFMIDNTGTYLFAANRDSDNITIFTIDKKSGTLDYSGITLSVSSPVCVKLLRFQAAQ